MTTTVSTSTDEPFLLDDQPLLESTELKSKLGPLEMESIRHVRHCVETVVGVLYNASTPLDSWKDYKDSVEKARNKFEPPTDADTEDSSGRLGFTYVPQEEESSSYKEVLQSCMEYVALFRVNRSAQSDVSEVNDMRYIEDVYVSLLEETYEIIKTAKATFNGNITESIKALTQKLMDQANHLHETFLGKIETLNCAYRSRLLDKLSWVSYRSQANLRKALNTMEESHRKTMTNLEKSILKGKKDSYDRASDIAKFRTQITKYTKLMRKHGIVDHDDYISIDDEKIKTDNILDHYQKVLFNRQEKIKKMKHQIKELSEILDTALENEGRNSTAQHRSPSVVSKGATARKMSTARNTPGKGKRASSSSVAPKISENGITAPELSTVDEIKEWIMRSAPDSQGRISLEETLLLLEETRTIYEEKITKTKDDFMSKIIAERNDLLRLEQEFQKQYDEILRDVNQDPEIQDSITDQQTPMVSRVQYLFPVNIRPNMRSIEVQCDLENPPPLVLLAPLKQKEEDTY
ncbi:UNVERIFIED_CONTAM: hypothetical protein HDU68_007581 [Siphonaria sp. JEL0065]|nr:hypothetical protein HDU68_007581 [Siphonaria sp. JEL0065]